MTIQISVVVPTYQRHFLLERCLKALLDQDLPPQAYEIIIVDDADCTQTRALVDVYAAGSQQTVRYLTVSGANCVHGPAAARNRGWKAAQGAIVAFTDDDCIPARNWLSAGLSAFVGDVVGASGRIRMPLPDDPTDYEYNAAQLEQSEFATANCFYRYDALQQVDGFDERFTAAWREDSDLFFTLLEHGKKCVFVPEAVVLHPIRAARWGISLSQQRKSMFNALLYKKHPDLYRQHIQSRPPWHYYYILLSLLVILLGLVTGCLLLISGACSAWLLLTGYFCSRRLYKTSRSPSHILEMIITSVLIPPLALFWRWRGMFLFRVFFL